MTEQLVQDPGDHHRTTVEQLRPCETEDESIDPGAVKEATRSHNYQNWRKVGLIGVGTTVLFGAGGFVLAPLVGAAIGAGAGLSGAAATSHGLAVLGGGALTAGGSGMAGGVWAISGIGAVVGAIGGGGGAALFQRGTAHLRGELVKLHAALKVGVLHEQADVAKTQMVIERQFTQTDKLRKELEEEREVNRENARRVKDLEEALRTMEEAVDSMKSRGGDT